jgi:hypothetical protein
MPIQSEKDVVEFQISVDDTILVEIFQSQANLGGVKSITDVSLDFTGTNSQLTELA